MADEHSLPGRLETKVMMPFPGFVSLHPFSTPGTCCLIWEMHVLTSGLSIKHNLHLLARRHCLSGDVILSALLTSASWIWRTLFARWNEKNYGMDSSGAVMEVVKEMEEFLTVSLDKSGLTLSPRVLGLICLLWKGLFGVYDCRWGHRK
ncbi:hypothetical protein CDAR_196191 [Caerostris darwini]|uniref:Uncharacterized protein n=1 Tax=Caerostris darwini TaxID=1538125 RepID=A0AAV4MGI5_9ARAC|nr:hypothetical protein CDAR_196191 [Caerostris darwini]